MNRLTGNRVFLLSVLGLAIALLVASTLCCAEDDGDREQANRAKDVGMSILGLSGLSSHESPLRSANGIAHPADSQLQSVLAAETS